MIINELIMRQWSLQPVFLGLFRHASDSPEDSGKSSRLNTCKNLCSRNYKEARPREGARPLTQGENHYQSLAGNKFLLILNMSNFFQISPRAAKIMIFACASPFSGLQNIWDGQKSLHTVVGPSAQECDTEFVWLFAPWHEIWAFNN